jgi:hypothetical protein
MNQKPKAYIVRHGYKIPEDRPTKTRENPSGQPTGDYTGRCWRCGSTNLWTDNLSYGCNSCRMMRLGS